VCYAIPIEKAENNYAAHVPDLRGCVATGRVVEETEQQIREASDELTGACPAWKNESESQPPLSAHEIVLNTGLRHGFLYRLLPE
jgi:predicted RNase H-like HicB family nuclease